MLLSLATVVAVAVSPVTIDVTTKDGSRRAIEHLDADATPVKVCAKKRNSADEPVCGDVVSDRYGVSAHVDIVDDGDVVFSTLVTRFDARAGAPAALAGGLGVAAVLCASGAYFFGVVSIEPVEGSVTGLLEPQEPSGQFGQASLLLWASAGAFAIGSGVAGYFAWEEAGRVVAE